MSEADFGKRGKAAWRRLTLFLATISMIGIATIFGLRWYKDQPNLTLSTLSPATSGRPVYGVSWERIFVQEETEYPFPCVRTAELTVATGEGFQLDNDCTCMTSSTLHRIPDGCDRFPPLR